MMQLHIGGLGLFEFEQCRKDINKINKDVRNLKIVSITDHLLVKYDYWVIDIETKLKGTWFNQDEYV